MMLRKNMGSVLKSIVELTLKTNANSTTCSNIYQPKAPMSLKKYSKNNDK